MLKNPSASAGDVRDASLIPGLGTFPWRRAWHPSPVFLPGESHGPEEPGGLQFTVLRRVEWT